jgi:predicted ATP-grasp superfamily ATP-dependent carboligase
MFTIKMILKLLNKLLQKLIAKNIMKKLEKLGNILICDIITIPVVAFWNTTWNLQDKYLLPDHYVLSNSLSVSVGRIAATNTISINNFPSYMYKKFHRPLQ